MNISTMYNTAYIKETKQNFLSNKNIQSLFNWTKFMRTLDKQKQSFDQPCIQIYTCLNTKINTKNRLKYRIVSRIHLSTNISRHLTGDGTEN